MPARHDWRSLHDQADPHDRLLHYFFLLWLTSFFQAIHRDRHDAIVCMYHDQGHAPMKLVSFETGVNVTIGLPIVRTSVDHGTAFDIAWQGKAFTASLGHALDYAWKLAGTTERARPRQR